MREGDKYTHFFFLIEARKDEFAVDCIGSGGGGGSFGD